MPPAPDAAHTLFHELSHSYNVVTGTMQRGASAQPGQDNGIQRAELQATGLPNDGVSHNFPGGSGPSTVNPFNENALRQEMGLPLRPNYNFPSTWNGGMGSPTAMAPTGTGGTSLATTGDPLLDRMLAASENGDLQGLARASSSLYERDSGTFKEQGVAELMRQQSEQSPNQPGQIGSPQIEQPEDPVASTGGMCR
ncbi:M91 family zinc metallopeptidase [Marilutibacter maris]|uniref:M91 family zinc metallopeptidase n=1 Tax=Marilutibacter maris TaxID=1605891 RepID=UPI00167D60DB|nr:M91 family zinc metallopeptidase [Lysobacter maris]